MAASLAGGFTVLKAQGFAPVVCGPGKYEATPSRGSHTRDGTTLSIGPGVESGKP